MARRKLEKANIYFPDNPINDRLKGDLFVAFKRYEQAASYFLSAVDREPRNADFNHATAFFFHYWMNNENDVKKKIMLYKKSIIYYNRALNIDPYNANYKLNRKRLKNEYKILLRKT